ncbi:hypothetical protein C8R43DRAFT_964287 [Mycena crocata]|nr:hypothetical protein C8R43DRAFT_964287 [Mycena crocata]
MHLPSLLHFAALLMPLLASAVSCGFASEQQQRLAAPNMIVNIDTPQLWACSGPCADEETCGFGGCASPRNNVINPWGVATQSAHPWRSWAVYELREKYRKFRIMFTRHLELNNNKSRDTRQYYVERGLQHEAMIQEVEPEVIYACESLRFLLDLKLEGRERTRMVAESETPLHALMPGARAGVAEE